MVVGGTLLCGRKGSVSCVSSNCEIKNSNKSVFFFLVLSLMVETKRPPKTVQFAKSIKINDDFSGQAFL